MLIVKKIGIPTHKMSLQQVHNTCIQHDLTYNHQNQQIEIATIIIDTEQLTKEE